MKILLIFISSLLLSSCAVYRTGFECPASKGVACKSVSEVNEMVERLELGGGSVIWVKDEVIDAEDDCELSS